MIDIILYVLAILALIAGSVTDFKFREVPDWISYGLIFSALGIRLLYSVFNKDILFFVYGIVAVIILYLLSDLLYYLRQWGGGDAKIMMGIGAVLGLNPLDVNSYLIYGILFMLLIFIGAFYGIGFSLYLALINKDKFKKTFLNYFDDFKYLEIFSVLFLIFGFAALFFINDLTLAFMVFAVSVIFFIGIVSFVFVKSVEDSCLNKKVKVSQLTEGDWVDETIKLNGKIIVQKSSSGITKAQIARLKHYRRLISVKEGIPFVPAFLLSFIALIAVRVLF